VLASNACVNSSNRWKTVVSVHARFGLSHSKLERFIYLKSKTNITVNSVCRTLKEIHNFTKQFGSKVKLYSSVFANCLSNTAGRPQQLTTLLPKTQ
jgi:hypothetical protein